MSIRAIPLVNNSSTHGNFYRLSGTGYLARISVGSYNPAESTQLYYQEFGAYAGSFGIGAELFKDLGGQFADLNNSLTDSQIGAYVNPEGRITWQSDNTNVAVVTNPSIAFPSVATVQGASGINTGVSNVLFSLDGQQTDGGLLVRIVPIEITTPLSTPPILINTTTPPLIQDGSTVYSPVPTPTPAAPLPTIYQVVVQHIFLPIDVYVVDPIPSNTQLTLTVNVIEPILAIEPLEIQVGTTAQLTPIEYDLTKTITDLAKQLIATKITTAFDTDIELKLLVNFGDDIQQLLLAKAYYDTPKGVSPQQIKLKLLEPLIADYDVGTEMWISREVASSVLDRINFLPAPLINTTPYLRPKNTNIRFANLSGKNLRNITWDKLNLNTTGNLIGTSSWSYQDEVMRRWYTDDWKSSELNIDFSDYANFVMYGSAEKRILAFVEKLKQIEFCNSQSYSADRSASLETSQKYALEIENTIRSFDPYETHLYFNSDMPYSASSTVTGTEYNADGTWPKISGSAVSPYSVEAETWLDVQLPIAQRYDDTNQNYLVSNLPGHVLDNEENTEFWDFIAMIGHYFDNLKPYIDASKYMYSRTPDVDSELSKDLIWQVAYSFGTELPNKSALDTLSRYLFGENNSLAGRNFTSEIWKRILHSYVYLTKMKGTRTAVRSIFHAFGITEHQLPIRETARPVTSSVFYSDESTYALRFNPGAFIIVPWTASIRDNYAVEFRFNTTNNVTTTFLNADSSWKLELVPHPTIATYSRIEVRNAVNATILSSSYDTFTDGTFYNVIVQKNLVGSPKIELDVRQTDGTRVLVSSYHSVPTSSFTTFDSPQRLYVGGSGSISTNNFSGSLDEFRVWGITLDDTTKEEHAYNPGSHTGNEISDAYNYLHVMLSFNKPENVAGSYGIVTNETPYFNKDGISKPFDILRTNLSILQTFGFANNATYPYQTNIITRVSRYRGIVGGSTSYVSNKVRIAAPPPTGSNYTLLSPKISIIPITDKREETKGGNIVGIFMSPTDVVNQMIYRAFGYFDLDDYIGYPGDKFESKYSSLHVIQNIFAQQYFKGYNPGEFVRFFDGFTNSIFEYLIEFIPAKAVLARGIIIEPSVLERSKQTLNYPLRVDGTGTRNTVAGASDTIYGLETTIETVEDTDLTGELGTFLADIGVEVQTVDSEYTTHEAHISESSRTEISYEYNYTETEITAFEVTDIESEFTLYENLIPINNETTITQEYLTFETSQSIAQSMTGDFENSNFDIYIPLNVNYTQSAVLPYQFANSIQSVYEIGPITDLNDSGVTTYFYQPDGIYDWINYVKRPITSSYMNIPAVIPSWTSGQFYKRGDIVQQVGVLDVYGNRLTGNNKYYVFTTDQQISGSTIVYFQSFNPPQYDTLHWEPVQYITYAYHGRKRVIYVDPTQQELLTGTVKLTWVDLDRIATDTGLRKQFTTENIELIGSATTQGIIKLEKSFIILALLSNKDNYRLRLYGNEESRTVDLNRAFGMEPDETVNVILDIKMESGTQTTEVRLNPPVTGTIDDDVLPNFVYYTIDNLDATTKNMQITFNLFILEGVLKVPREYLARHYRFFRDNSTGTKRRNYLGSLQTQDTTTDSKPPVEIFSSEGNTLSVQPGSNTIGGNEFLNVT
jgi:hypothetical protein